MKPRERIESSFSQRIAWVTGAGSGIGRALVIQLLDAGAWVVASDINEASLAALRADLSDAARTRLELAPLDVTDADAFAAIGADLRARHGHVDYLFNNAGVGVGGEASSIPAAQWREMIEVNVIGVMNGVHAVYPAMIARGAGHLVNFGSIAGLVPLPAEVPYSASKHAVVGMSRSLALEAKVHGVKVTTVCPGKIETPMYDSSPIYGIDKAALLRLIPEGVSAEACAAEILDGVARGKEMVLITKLAVFMHHLHRLAPALMTFLLSRYLVKIRSSSQAATAAQGRA